tara:strand:+ start:339 stop:1619 length:1281 start_codon:yes stop_codon:yes gene_type:complete
MIKQTLLIFILATSFTSSINAEEKSSKEISKEINFEKQKEEKIRLEIDQLKKEIKENDVFVKSKKNKLKELDKQMKLAEKLLEKVKEREAVLGNSISTAESYILDKKIAMDKIRNQYKEMIIHLYKNHNDGQLDILLNSNDWNELAYKAKYLEIISIKEKDMKDNLNSQITKLNNEIIAFVDNLDKIEKEKHSKKQNINQLNSNRKKQKQEIDKSHEEKDELTKKQFKKESDLKKIKKMLEKLYIDKDIAKKREDEIRKKREEEARKIKEEEERKRKILNQKFANNKGKLSWPVDGKIKERKGQYKNRHSDGSVVKGYNKWVKIETSKNQPVSLPFDGVISSIEVMDLYRGVIIVDHGDRYYSVYANLNENLDKKLAIGEYYSKDTFIGVVGDSEDGKSGELNFGIWKFPEDAANPQYLNPEEWIE